MVRNNHGWGLKEMLFLSAILLFFVLLIAVLVSQLYGNVSSDSNTSKNKSYTLVEQKLSSAAKRYYRSNKENNVILSDDLVLEDYLSLDDLTVDQDICEGYVVIENNQFQPFITCNHYETEGY